MFADAWKPFHASARDGLTPPQHTGQIPPPRQHQSAFLAEGLPAGQTFVPGLPTAPFLTSIFFGFHASAVVKKCSSSRRYLAPLVGGSFRPRLLTDAAYSSLGLPTARRPQRTHLHHWHSTDHLSLTRTGDLLHRFHSPFRTHAGTRR